jgi:AcrR family transcriptional regulator
MSSKTRDKLIDVARQLFASKGVENTTMLDIAEASDKGRRTIYTYFRNKREIHQAVIEKDSEQIVSRHRMIQKSAMSPAEKLEQFIRARIDLQIQHSHHKFYDPEAIRNLIAGERISKTRRAAAMKRIEIFRSILNEGIECGDFDVAQAHRLEPLVIILMQGADNPVVSANFEALGFNLEKECDKLIDFIIEGIKPRCISEEKPLNTDNKNCKILK